MRFRISTIWAFVALEDDQEGICAQMVVGPGGNTWMPMIGADEKRLEQLRPIAAEIAKASGKRIELIRFVRGAVVETFEGGRN